MNIDGNGNNKCDDFNRLVSIALGRLVTLTLSVNTKHPILQVALALRKLGFVSFSVT